MLLYPLRQFRRLAITQEMLLGFAVLAGVLITSSAWREPFTHFLQIVPFPALHLTTRAWLNEGLLSLFFAILGVELRADFEVGPLKDWRKALFPLSAAVAAAIIPVLFVFLAYLIAPYHQSGLRGWGIPVASAPVLTLPLLALTTYLPSSIKSFVRAILVFNDIFAIGILIGFYGDRPDMLWLAFAGILTLVLIYMGKFIKKRPKLKPKIFYFMTPVAVLLWVVLCQAGTPASMAGLIFGIALPHRPGHVMIHELSQVVSWIILPLFAICNTTIDLRSFAPVFFEDSTFWGPFLGFALGKPIGIFGAIYLCEKAGLQAPWKRKYRHWLVGAVMSCALGFTVSLLMTQLAYTNPIWQMQAEAGIGAASILSTFITLFFLRRSDRRVAREKALKNIPIAMHGMR